MGGLRVRAFAMDTSLNSETAIQVGFREDWGRLVDAGFGCWVDTSDSVVKTDEKLAIDGPSCLHALLT